MSSVIVAGDTSGSVTLQAPAVSGSTVLTLPAVSGTLISSGGAASFTDLTTTGNTILGDASTDTLNVGNGGLIKDASGNVGIGRTPVNKLDIGTSFTSQSSTGINASAKSIRIGNGEAGVLFTTDINTAGSSSGTQTSSAQVGYTYFSSTYPTDFVIGTNTQTVASNLRFYNNNSEVMRLDSSGNLGLGVTPSAWGSSFDAIQVGAGSALWGETGLPTGTYLSSNLYYNGTNRIYIGGTYKPAEYSLYNGIHTWSSAAAGTAGTTITLTSLMTLDASGNLGIGTASPAARLHATTNSAGTPTVIIVENAGNQLADRGVALDLFSPGNGLGVSGTRVTGRFTSASAATSTQGSYLTFSTENTSGTLTERMRLTATGHLELTTGHYYGLFTGTDYGIELRPTLGTSGAVFASFLNNSGTRIGSISRNTTTNAVLYNTTSDERLKENIADSNPVLETISKIKVRQYDWKDANVHQDYGFIAQELDAVIDGVVTKPDDEELMWSVDYSKITPHLVKAIQEQQAMIDELKAKVAALEAA
jgi:hypothetical protein